MIRIAGIAETTKWNHKSLWSGLLILSGFINTFKIRYRSNILLIYPVNDGFNAFIIISVFLRDSIERGMHIPETITAIITKFEKAILFCMNWVRPKISRYINIYLKCISLITKPAWTIAYISSHPFVILSMVIIYSTMG